MFFLISFVIAKNICVEKTLGKCKKTCSMFNGEFNDTFSYFPNDDFIKSSNDGIHDIYVADNVTITKTTQNVHICDPSIQLTYSDSYWSKIIINDQINVGNNKISKNIPILFKTHYNFSLEIDTTENSSYSFPIIFEAKEENIFITPKFFTSNIPKNIVSISKNSYDIKIFDITKNVKTLFSDTGKLNEIPKTYYCISDKQNKCEQYSSKNLTFINSPSEITNFPIVLIVDTSLPQFFTANYREDYAHIICLKGSDISYYPNYKNSGSDFYLILHENTIEMTNCFFEGEGKFTLSFYNTLLIHSATKINNNHFILKNQKIFSYSSSSIRAYKPDYTYEIKNKIIVPEFNVFHGDDCLVNIFEEGKFIRQSEFVKNIFSVDDLKEYYYNDFAYYLKQNETNIEQTWKKPCHFIGNSQNNITFNDVYSFTGSGIDGFISVSNFDTINIRPSKYFYLKRFSDYPRNIKFNIHVNHDFYMRGYEFQKDASISRDEIDKSKCTITGNGTINFLNSTFMKDVLDFCTYDKNSIKFNFIETMPKINVCIGQSSIDKCKPEIDDVSFLQGEEWIWLRNIQTLSYIINSNKVYLTGNHTTTNVPKSVNITGNSNLIYYTNSGLDIYNNGTYNIKALKSSAKLTIIFNFNNDYNYPYDKKAISIYYQSSPTDINLRLYLHYDFVKLYQYYIENFENNSVLLDGKGVIYIREPYIPMINIFKKSDEITFSINPDPDYHQICYAENVNECTSLYDFVFVNNYNKFVEYDSQSLNAVAYLYKNISMQINSHNYICNHFYVQKISISFDIPNLSTIIFGKYYDIEIIANKSYCFSFQYFTYDDIIFNIKDTLILDCWDNIHYRIYNIRFNSSKDSTEIIANPNVKDKMSNYYYRIKCPDNFSIFSPVPQYIQHLFNSSYVKQLIINQSPSWSYLYLSNEAKELFESFKAFSINDYLDDITLSRNIVLAVGKNDLLSIPSNWSYHNIYVLQENNILLNDQPTNLTYLHDGIILNNKTKIICGNISINVPTSFTVNAFIPNGYYMYKFMYDVELNCSNNSATTLHIGSIFVNHTYYYTKPVYITGYGVQNKLKIRTKNQNDIHDFKLILYASTDENINYDFGYDYICYYPHYSVSSKCNGKFYEASDVTTLLYAVMDNPGIPISVGQDLTIPCCTGNNFILNPIEKDILIKLPDAPDSMMISENNSIQVNYFDSLINIINKTRLEVALEDYFELDFNSNTTSKITFSLESNVLISTRSNYSTNFSISVIRNSYHFYSEYFNYFGDMFGNKLEPYIKICAYYFDYDSIQFCSFKNKDLISNIFTDPFNYNYNEIEIAPIKTNEEISLPSINKQTNIYILDGSTATLSISTCSNVDLSSEYFILNEYWNLLGDLKILEIILDKKSLISVSDQLNIPINLQLSSQYSIIDLKDCIEQSIPRIDIHKYGNESNEIIIYGENSTYTNFINSINHHEGISLILNGTQKYLCVCKDIESCEKCQENIEGNFELTKKIINDPGKNVKIRVFSNVEINTNMLTNVHDVFVDPDCSLNLTDVINVNQNLTKGIQIDNLLFMNMNYTNVHLKPRDSTLNITMRKGEWGPHFSIEVDSFLKLNAVNSKEENVNASRIYVYGHGELNTYNYPSNMIRPESNVKIIKGVYIICGSKNGNSMCSYNSNQGYNTLSTCNDFREDFDPDSKIVVFLDSFSSSVDVHLHILRKQKIQFIRKPNALRLLNNQNKLRILATKEITNKADLTTELSATEDRGAVFDSTDSDLFIIGFNETLSIKQEGDVPENISAITIQPMSEKVEIRIDNSVDMKKQKVKIETESEKKVSVSIVTNKTIENETIFNNFLSVDKEKVNVTIENEAEPTEKNPTVEPEETKLLVQESNGSTKGIIIGIVVAAVVVVIVIIVLVIVFVKRKKVIILSNLKSDVSSDSIGI